MRSKLLVPILLVFLGLGAFCHADAIRYDQIPSDASSFFHLDVDRMVSSQFVKMMSGPGFDVVTQEEALFGGRISSVTAYAIGATPKIVFMVRGDARLRQKAESVAAATKDVVAITYAEQKVYFSPSNPFTGSTPRKSAPATAPSQTGSSFSLSFPGLGQGATDLIMNGPTYTAFNGDNLILVAGDLQSITAAIDVARGTKTSLATNDPKGLKSDPMPGAILHGVGLAAQISGDTLNHDATPAAKSDGTTAHTNNSGPFGFDLFGSFKGKALLARIDMGEDEKNVYLTASLGMIDLPAAEQLKNLSIGIKALLSLSNMEQKRLIDPLEIQISGKDVVLAWKWPTANLDDLVRVSQSSKASGSRTTQP